MRRSRDDGRRRPSAVHRHRRGVQDGWPHRAAARSLAACRSVRRVARRRRRTDSACSAAAAERSHSGLRSARIAIWGRSASSGRGWRIRRRAPERHRDAAADARSYVARRRRRCLRCRTVCCAARDPRRRLPARPPDRAGRRVSLSAADLPWTLLPSSTPIQPLIVGDVSTALAVSDALLARGILVPAIRPPTVPAGTARLRVSLSAAHSPEDVDALTAALHAIARSGA